MPILLKKISGSVISYFGNERNDFIGDVKLVKKIKAEVGLDTYILLPNFEAFVQDFSSVIEAEYCETTPTNLGSNGCTTYNDLNLSF